MVVIESKKTKTDIKSVKETYEIMKSAYSSIHLCYHEEKWDITKCNNEQLIKFKCNHSLY